MVETVFVVCKCDLTSVEVAVTEADVCSRFIVSFTLCAHGHNLFLWFQLCMTVFRNEPDHVTPWALPQTAR